VGATLLEGTVDRCLVYLVDVSGHRQSGAEEVRSLVEEQSARALAESAVRRLEGILTVTDTALTRLDSNDFLTEILGRVRTVLEADSAAVWLVDEDNRHLAVRASQGMEAELTYAQRIPFGQGAIGRVATTRQLVIVEDLPRTEIGNLFLAQPLRSLLAVPLMSNNKVIGALHIGTSTPRVFTPNEAHLLQLVAERVATAIERSQLFDEVRSSREQLDALSRRLLEVQENERRHVARELHDDIGQTLTAVKIGLLALRSAPNMAVEVLEEGLNIVDEAIDRVRRLSRHLRPAVLDDLGLVAALSWLVKQQSFSSTRCVLEAPEDGRFPPQVETACFRVAQEALNNALRHAQASAVRIQLAIRGGNLNLSITDDGVGFIVEEAQERNRQGESLGLLNMEERVRLAGGRFSIQSKPGRGTLVRAIFSLKSVTSPLDEEEDEAIDNEMKGSALE
jgi:signal transduction histidine kinase